MKHDWPAIFPELLGDGQVARDAGIALLLDTAREVVSRLLKDSEQRNLVRLQRGSIALLDRDRLDALATG